MRSSRFHETRDGLERSLYGGHRCRFWLASFIQQATQPGTHLMPRQFAFAFRVKFIEELGTSKLVLLRLAAWQTGDEGRHAHPTADAKNILQSLASTRRDGLESSLLAQ